MSKIKLNLESLRVESFATGAAEAGEGTVFGYAKTLVACGSWIDACPSSPPAATLPCNGCVGTELC
jgi:hypothetical protein